MNKTHLKKFRQSLLALLIATGGAVPWQSASADVLLKENFEYPAGDLYGHGGWIRNTGAKTNKLNLSQGGLSYAGYLTNPVGCKAELSNAGNTDNLMRFFDKDVTIQEGTVYVSMLINVKELVKGSAHGYFFGMIPQTKNGLTDGGSGTDYCKLFIVPTSDGQHYNIAMSRGGGYSVAEKSITSSNLALNTTYLMVVSYKFVPGVTNDEMQLWINPKSTTAAPEATITLSTDDASGEPSIAKGGLKAVVLRQAKTSSNAFPNMSIDGLHVATTWAELFDDGKGPVVLTPAILPTAASFQLGGIMLGDSRTVTATVKAENLKGDITVTCPDDITCTPATIAKADAESETGAGVTFTVTPTEESDYYQRTITLSSEGAQNVTLSLTGSVTKVTKLATVREIIEAGHSADNAYIPLLFTGKAVVTGIDKFSSPWGGSSTSGFYMQDETGGVMINDMMGAFTEMPSVGDELTNLQFWFTDASSKIAVVYPMVSVSYLPAYEITAHNVAVEPEEVAVKDLNAANFVDYAYRLLKVKDVNFVDPAGKTFAAANSYFTQDGVQAAAQALPDSPLIGTQLPEGTVSLTGVSRSQGALVLGLRTEADIEEAAVPAAKIITGQASHDFGVAIVGRPFTFSTTVKGENLTDAITVTCPADITCDKTSVSVEEAAEGATLTFTVTPSKEDEEYDAVITFSTPGAENLDFHVTGYAVAMTNLANTTQVKAQYDDPNVGTNNYFFTGKLVVTGINTDHNGDLEIFAQDMVGGIRISTLYTATPAVSPFKVGDEITNFAFFLSEEDGVNLPTMYIGQLSESYPLFEKTAEGKTKSPVEISLADITKVTAPEYLYRLVTVKDVYFTDAAGKKYTASNMTFTDGTDSAVARAFRNCDLIDQDLPTGSVTLTGISYSAAQLTLLLRDSRDVTAGAPTLAVTKAEKLVDFTATAAPVGEATAIMKLTVAAENLPAEAPVQVYGNDEQYFYTEPNAIPAGSGVHELTVFYKPLQTGRHKTMLLINTDSFDATLNYTRQLDGKAYDPQNMPAITLDPATVELETTPGTPVTATVKFSAASCFDYINVTRASQAGNGITINSTLLLPTQEEFVITFNPTEEGEFTETFTFASTMADPATLTVKAVSKGQLPPQEKEGDEFIVSSENPLYTYVQDFESVSHNTPLKLEGWTNVAMQGTRAWWGYQSTDEEAFKAAKATAYDSKVLPADGQPAEMTLISPALDYANAGTKILEFRLMGMYLDKSQETRLEILFGEPNGTAQPDFYAMDGFDVPVDPAQAGEWIPYQVDMSAVPDMPDVFFIAFRLKSTRSQAEPATYYIDDFAWNRTGTTSVDTVMRDGRYDVFNLQGIRILTDADAEAVKALPAGLYIVNGKKVILK